MIEKHKETLPEAQLSQYGADGAYSTGSNLKYLQDNNIGAFIPESKEHLIDSEKVTFVPSSFVYNEDNDEFTCPNNKVLDFLRTNSSDGKIRHVYACTVGVCMRCPHQEQCLTSKQDKKLGYRTIQADLSKWVNNSSKFFNRTNLNKENVVCRSRIKFIAVGASTGGTQAFRQILQELPSVFPCIGVVQHMPVGFTRHYAESLNQETGLRVKEAESGDKVAAGMVFIAPSGRQMGILKQGDEYFIEIYDREHTSGLKPSVDFLFESLAGTPLVKLIIGVILTGMGKDGARGLLKMENNGEYTLGQDEKSSIVYGMPKAAFDLLAVEKQMALSEISSALMEIIKTNRIG